MNKPSLKCRQMLEGSHSCRSLPGQQQQLHHHQQQQVSITSLPEHVIDIIACMLDASAGSSVNFRRSCRAFRAAGYRNITTVDLSELCGWGDSSHTVPQQAFVTTQLCPTITALIFPGGWRYQHITQLLRYAAQLSSSWKQLSSVSLHFQALDLSTASVLAELAPNLTQLTLSLDLAFEQTRHQAARISALQQLPKLASLVVETDLRPEALRQLALLPKLQQLKLAAVRPCSPHPQASLQALLELSKLTSLHFNWQAGRTLATGQLLAAMTSLRELQLWLSGGRELPPCSSKPLKGMLEAVGQLTGLTRLELLHGLYMSWDLRDIRHLSGLRALKVLGLHDSVLCDDDLALLAPCTSLQHLKVDCIKMPAIRSTADHMADTHAVHAMPAAAHAAAAGSHAAHHSVNPVALALTTLNRLRKLEVNMLLLGLWQLAEICPQLTSLTPFGSSLGAKGHGVVWDLGAIEGHPEIQTLGLMVGALGTACSCNKSYTTANCAETLAAAVVRVIMQSAGVGRLGCGGPGGCSMQQVLTVVQSLPALADLQLWGHAGGVGGKLLASFRPVGTALGMVCNGSSSSSSSQASPQNNSSKGGSSSSSTWSETGSVSSCGSPNCLASAERARGFRPHRIGSSVAAAVGDVLSSFGVMLGSGTRTDSTLSTSTLDKETKDVTGDGDQSAALNFDARGQGCSHHRDVNITCTLSAALCMTHRSAISAGTSDSCAVSCVCSGRCTCTADADFVQQLLQGLPQLRTLQLKKCDYLSKGGWDLAVQLCSRVSDAAVLVSK